MSMNRLPIRLLTALVCAFALSSPVLAADTNVRTVVTGLNSTWNDAFNRGDATAVAALYDEKATLSAGNGKTLVGRAEIEKLFKSFIDGGVHKHTIDIIEVYGNGDFAYEVATWRAMGREKDGKEPAFGGVLTNVFERGTDGKWRSMSHVWNTSID
jgi:uncharacterized protein (TIGR02246 family)